MARTLLRTSVIMLEVCAGSACLLPQENQLLNPVPPVQNRPPRILEDQVSPTRFITTNNGARCQIVFSFRVEDPEIDEVLYTNWYIDYYIDPRVVRDETIQPSGTPVRDNPAELRIDFQAAENPLRTEGYHLVEGMVADGPIVGRVAQPINGRPSYAATYAWMVKVERGPCPP